MTSERCDLICLDLPRARALREARLTLDAAQNAAERARALSDPTRLMLTTALGSGEELCVCDLAWISERPQNLVSHHLRALRAQGLVRSRREGRSLLRAVLAPVEEPKKKVEERISKEILPAPLEDQARHSEQRP